jgi:hypothetical protein
MACDRLAAGTTASSSDSDAGTISPALALDSGRNCGEGRSDNESVLLLQPSQRPGEDLGAYTRESLLEDAEAFGPAFQRPTPGTRLGFSGRNLSRQFRQRRLNRDHRPAHHCCAARRTRAAAELAGSIGQTQPVTG